MLGTAHNNYTKTVYDMFRDLVKWAKNQPNASQLIDDIIDFHDAHAAAIARYRDFGHRTGAKSLPGRIQADATFAFLDVVVGGASLRQRMLDRLAEGVPDEEAA